MAALIEEVRFARDSPLEGAGFEPSVPRLGVSSVVAPTAPTGLKGSAAARRDRVRDCPRELADVRVGCGPRSYKLGARPAIVQLNLLFAASHSMERGAGRDWRVAVWDVARRAAARPSAG